MIPWQDIKAEYITTDTSYRKLAKKYGIGYQTICHKSKAEGWLDQRERYKHKTITKTLNAIGNRQAERAARLQSVADKLLDKIESAVDDLQMQDLLHDRQSLKQLTGALKDIKDIQMIRSEADLREQEARIRNLQKQADEVKGREEPIRVIIDDGASEYSK